MTKIYRILGKRGRVTIPYAFRQQVGFGFNDVLSFTIQEPLHQRYISKEGQQSQCTPAGGNANPDL